MTCEKPVGRPPEAFPWALATLFVLLLSGPSLAQGSCTICDLAPGQPLAPILSSHPGMHISPLSTITNGRWLLYRDLKEDLWLEVQRGEVVRVSGPQLKLPDGTTLHAGECQSEAEKHLTAFPVLECTDSHLVMDNPPGTLTIYLKPGYMEKFELSRSPAPGAGNPDP